LFDFLVSALSLIALIPLLLVVALTLYASIGSPVFFMQERPGLSGRSFRVYKFRTMSNECDASGRLLPDQQRLTSFGSLLRKLSIDELPQLFNVLKGDMSLVGPRPLLMEYLPLYSPEQMRRHEVRPGITGWAQVNGRNALGWEERFRLDLWYVDHRSFWLDMKILLLTARKVLVREGISAAGQATMSKFTGSREQ